LEADETWRKEKKRTKVLTGAELELEAVFLSKNPAARLKALQLDQQLAQRQKLRKEITRAQFNALLKEGQTVKYFFSPVQIVGFNADRTSVTICTATGRNMDVNINQITPNNINLYITPND